MSEDPIIPDAGSAPFRCEVIDLAGVRVEFGRPARTVQRCEHKRVTYSQEERRVWCRDCERTIDGFDAFMTFVRYYEHIERAVRQKMTEANAAMEATIHRRATKAVDKAWSSGLPAISCPHCRGGILPEDFADGVTRRSSREYELARRKKQPVSPP